MNLLDGVFCLSLRSNSAQTFSIGARSGEKAKEERRLFFAAADNVPHEQHEDGHSPVGKECFHFH